MSKRLIDMTEEDLDAREERLLQRFVETLGAGEASRLLDRDGAARLLGCSTRQVDRLVKQGAPYLLVGDSKRFEAAELLGWLRGRRAPGLRVVNGGSNATRQ